MTEPTEPRQPVSVRCEVCEHKWVAAYLPLEISKYVRIMRGMRCPMCAANAKHIYLSDVKG